MIISEGIGLMAMSATHAPPNAASMVKLRRSVLVGSGEECASSQATDGQIKALINSKIVNHVLRSSSESTD
ncbi:Uncharacterised protein [Klebsiella pneumoniae]|nr:Uncharacterised protein [Klebsiella pneumoniae]